MAYVGTTTASVTGTPFRWTIYDDWYLTGKNMAIRQQLRHKRSPQFAGAIDDEAPCRPKMG